MGLHIKTHPAAITGIWICAVFLFSCVSDLVTNASLHLLVIYYYFKAVGKTHELSMSCFVQTGCVLVSYTNGTFYRCVPVFANITG